MRAPVRRTCEEPVAGGVDLAAAKTVQLVADHGVVPVEQHAPLPVAQLHGAVGRTDDVGEQHGREHAVGVEHGRGAGEPS